MNFSETFIRRPIATSLLMAGIALFGVVAYRGSAGQRPAQRRFSHAQRSGQPARRRSGHHGVGGGDPARTPVHHHRRHRLDDLQQRHRPAPRSRSSSTSAAISTAPPWTCRRPSPKPCRCCRPACPRRPPSASSTPPTQPIIYLFADLRPPCASSDLDEYAETMIAQRISMVNGVAQVQVWGATKYAVRVQVDPDKLASKKIGINEVEPGHAQLERQYLPPARCTEPSTVLQHEGQRPIDERRGFQAPDRGLAQRRSGPAGRSRQRDRQRGERQERLLDLQRRYGKDGTRAINLR